MARLQNLRNPNWQVKRRPVHRDKRLFLTNFHFGTHWHNSYGVTIGHWSVQKKAIQHILGGSKFDNMRFFCFSLIDLSYHPPVDLDKQIFCNFSSIFASLKGSVHDPKNPPCWTFAKSDFAPLWPSETIARFCMEGFLSEGTMYKRLNTC